MKQAPDPTLTSQRETLPREGLGPAVFPFGPAGRIFPGGTGPPYRYPNEKQKILLPCVRAEVRGGQSRGESSRSRLPAVRRSGERRHVRRSILVQFRRSASKVAAMFRATSRSRISTVTSMLAVRLR